MAGGLFDAYEPPSAGPYGPLPARRTDPPTSRAAAERVTASGTRARHLDLVEALVRRHPGSTAVELWEAQAGPGGLERHEISRRLADLRNLGRVRQGPARVCRCRGTMMVTWVVTGGL